MFCSFLLYFIPVHVGQQYADGEFRHLDGAAQSEDDRVEAILDRQRWNQSLSCHSGWLLPGLCQVWATTYTPHFTLNIYGVPSLKMKQLAMDTYIK